MNEILVAAAKERSAESHGSTEDSKGTKGESAAHTETSNTRKDFTLLDLESK